MRFLFLIFLLLSATGYCDSESTFGGKTAQAHIIQSSGTSIRPRPYLDFETGLSAVDSNGKTVVSIGGSGGNINLPPNVGIGSSAPGQALDVNGTVRASGFTQTGASVNTFAGNVGLGLTVPSYLLDVNGAARLNGVLNFVPSTASGLDGGSSAANSAGSTMTITSARGGVGGGTQEAGGALNLESGNGWSLNGSLTNAPVNIFAGQSDGIGTVQGWIDIHGASPFGGGYTNNENGGHVYIHGGDGYGGGAPGNGGNVFVSAGKGNGTSNVNGTVILGYSGIAESNTSVGDITNVSIGTKTATSQLTVAGAYTQTGSLANTITGTTSFSGSPSITTSGNVGIGSTAPGTALDVNGTIRATSYQNVFPSSSAGQILASPSANTPTWTSNILVSGTNTLFTAGNVGIGSSVPGTALDVIGTVRIGGGSGNQYLSGSGGNVGIGTTLSALNRLDVAGNVTIGTSLAGYQSAPSNGLIVQGNVGIGSTVPGQLLDVGGTVRFTNSLINTKSSTGIGWSEHNATNQACNTTCGTSACVMALDIGTVGVINSGFVSCSDATADDCECAGP